MVSIIVLLQQPGDLSMCLLRALAKMASLKCIWCYITVHYNCTESKFALLRLGQTSIHPQYASRHANKQLASKTSSNMPALAVENEVKGERLFRCISRCVYFCKKKSTTLSAIPQECIVKCIFAFLEQNIRFVCVASMETFATGRTLWRSSREVQLVSLFRCCTVSFPYTAH